MKYLLILLTLLTLKASGQTDSVINRMIKQKLDSFKMTLDSVQVLDKTVTGTAITTIDTLLVPKNTMGIYTITYMLDDGALTRQMAGGGQKVAYITNWNGNYGVMAVLDQIPYISNAGLPQGPLWIRMVNGLPMVQIGNPSTVKIKWRFFIESKLEPL